MLVSIARTQVHIAATLTQCEDVEVRLLAGIRQVGPLYMNSILASIKPPDLSHTYLNDTEKEERDGQPPHVCQYPSAQVRTPNRQSEGIYRTTTVCARAAPDTGPRSQRATQSAGPNVRRH